MVKTIQCTQLFFWRGKYKSGKTIEEGDGFNFSDLDLSKLRYFTYVGPFDLKLDCKTGLFYRNGDKLLFPRFSEFFKLPVNYGEGLIQKKDVEAEFSSRNLEKIEKLSIKKYLFGWKIHHDGWKYEIKFEMYPDKMDKIYINFAKTNLKTGKKIPNTRILKGTVMF